MRCSSRSTTRSSRAIDESPMQRPDAGYLDVTTLQLQPKDVVVFRSSPPPTQEQAQQLALRLRETYPEWHGVLLVGDVTTDLLPLSHDQAVALRDHLNTLLS